MQDKRTENAALLKRLRRMLLDQQEHYQDYLQVLKQENFSIKNGNDKKLEVQSKREKEIAANIFKFQKVINPLEELYLQRFPEGMSGISELRESLFRMKSQALELNAENRTMIRKNMDELRREISELRIPKRRKSPYGRNDSPTMLDMTT